MTNNNLLETQGLNKTFTTDKGENVDALYDVNLVVKPNEFVCIVGPSGCGKSTLLRILAGLEAPSSGRVLLKGTEITGPGRERGMVFQEYSLMPWRNVEENIWMGPQLFGKSKDDCRAIARKYIELVKLNGFERALPHELSGGMRQRVAIARALANDPEILLMDEPFGALDSYTRIILQKELLKIWQANRKTVLFITHSVDEAVFLADRVVVMSARPGKVVLEEFLDIPHPRKRDNPLYAKTLEKILELLDSYTRIILQKELLKIWQANRKTVLFITHSVDEAVFLADRVVVMSARPGKVVLEEFLDIPHPRKRDNPLYAKTLEKILELLENEQS